MADKGFKGSTLTFGGSLIGDITDIEFTDDGGPVDVTTLDSAVREFVAGIADLECTISTKGISSVVQGDTGTLVIAWNDGTADGGGTQLFLCTNRGGSGSEGGPITTALTFKPTPS